MRPISTDPNGVTTVAMRITHIRASANGQTVHVPNQTTRIKLSPNGEMVGGDGVLPTGGKGSYLLPGSDQIAPSSPTTPCGWGNRGRPPSRGPSPWGAGRSAIP